MASKHAVKVLEGSFPQQPATIEKRVIIGWALVVKPKLGMFSQAEAIPLKQQLRQFELVDTSDTGSADKAIVGAIAGGLVGDLIGPLAGTAGFLLGAAAGMSGNVVVAMAFADGRKALVEMPDAIAAELRAIVHVPDSAGTALDKALRQGGQSDVRDCPFCAETIKAAAVVCRYCGRDLPADPRRAGQALPATTESRSLPASIPTTPAPAPPEYKIVFTKEESADLPGHLGPGEHLLAAVEVQRGFRQWLLALTNVRALLVFKKKGKPAKIEEFPLVDLHIDHKVSMLASEIVLHHPGGSLKLPTSSPRMDVETFALAFEDACS